MQGFSLHVAVRCGAEDRQGLEQLCRYITRPALAIERVQGNAAGQVVLTLKTPWRDSTTHLVMSPLEFIQRLAALVPRPRLHLIRFHGVLAPNAKLGAMVVPQEPEQPAQAAPATDGQAQCAHHRPMRLSWAAVASVLPSRAVAVQATRRPGPRGSAASELRRTEAKGPSRRGNPVTQASDVRVRPGSSALGRPPSITKTGSSKCGSANLLDPHGGGLGAARPWGRSERPPMDSCHPIAAPAPRNSAFECTLTGLRLTKRLLREGQHMQLESLLETSAGFQAIAHKTPQHVEATKAFIEKRKPDFSKE